MIKKFWIFFRKQQYTPSVWGVFFNSFYIARRAIYLYIKKYSYYITGKTLDVGCGVKPYKNLFYLASDYIGMDVEISGHDHKNEYIDIYYDGANFPFENNIFDSIVSTQVLEHVADPMFTIKEIARVLKPGGILLLTLPFLGEEHEQPYDFFRFTSFKIKQCLEDNNMQIIVYEKLNNNIILVLTSLWATYLSKIIKTENFILSTLLKILLITPFICLGKLFSLFTIHSNDFFSDSFVIAKKR